MNDRDFRLLTARISLVPPMLPAKRVADAARAALLAAARRLAQTGSPRKPA